MLSLLGRTVTAVAVEKKRRGKIEARSLERVGSKGSNVYELDNTG